VSLMISLLMDEEKLRRLVPCEGFREQRDSVTQRALKDPWSSGVRWTNERVAGVEGERAPFILSFYWLCGDRLSWFWHFSLGILSIYASSHFVNRLWWWHHNRTLSAKLITLQENFICKLPWVENLSLLSKK
jgi:hypothetical protein